MINIKWNIEEREGTNKHPKYKNEATVIAEAASATSRKCVWRDDEGGGDLEN